MKRALLLFLALHVPLVAWAGSYDVLVVCDKTTSAGYAALTIDAEQANGMQLMAVQRVLNGWGARYRIMPPSAVTTAMCASGLVYLNKTPNAYGYVATGPVDTFASVIHCGFNGSGTSQFTAYRPDSATRITNGREVLLPTVPQLYLFDAAASGGDFNFNNGATDSSWVPAGGLTTLEHHFGGTHTVPGRTSKWTSISTSTCALTMKSGQPPGGLRVLMAQHTNGQTLPEPDYVGSSVNDTAQVYEKLNIFSASDGLPSATYSRMVFASVNTYAAADSAARIAHWRADIEWPALCFAIAHLDSLTGGRIIRKPRQFGFVIVGGGTTSARQHPGGLFQASDRADTLIHRASGDSVAATGAKIVVAAAPESLSAAEAMRWKRFGQVRFTPWVRVGLDTAGVSATSGAGRASFAIPQDVWGRYRNRAFYGDSESHTVMGSDSSIYQLYKAARANLRSIVGESYLSRLIVAPDDDWSPYQMRRNQNGALIDSVAWVAAKLGCPAILCNTWARDMDPTYLTNPKGYIFKNRSYTIQAASLRGVNVNFVGHQQFTVMGHQIHSATDAISFVGGAASDTTIAQLFFYSQMPTYAMYAFWNSFYGPYDGVNWNDGAGSFPAGVRGAWSSTAFDNVPGTHQPAEVMVLPAQAFGGQSTTTPNRWGFWAIKHVMGAADQINYAAGRPVLLNVWPEEIVP